MFAGVRSASATGCRHRGRPHELATPEVCLRLLEGLSIPQGTSRKYFIYTGLLCNGTLSSMEPLQNSKRGS
jgi:hypothetical protein